MSPAYHCQWIEHETLISIAHNRFGKAIREYQAGKFQGNNAEPTLILGQGLLMDMEIEELRKANAAVALTKTLQNAIGLFHQDVLGSAPGWSSTGSSGGGFDIRSEHKISLAGDRKVLAEVKMRHNTIKGSEKPGVFDRLKNAYVLNGRKEYVSYLIEIIPAKKNAYDEPWKVSNRTIDEQVRHIDGVSAYHLVTGDPEGLRNVYLDFPEVMAETIHQILKENRDLKITDDDVDSLIDATLPAESAYLTDRPVVR
ncbi:Eco47II family restriction endonuclease [Corynebacterium sp. sy017]|uniref:Eco47II family restriction endonuclease n=1 Tax=unclassified Corynebacterium TaxID=2624378 RepID=UPI001185DE1F|nr:MULTISPECIES: Eco47II family restriction endonuclease [unclassified Corynebacterium]MBP3088511.1 Eco47II family restriction endonuclease [Corynebacterium sp. sy017]TSD91816.1 Eco47II family restriction endonuclease [Corynebacterium sp. SY003]